MYLTHEYVDFAVAGPRCVSKTKVLVRCIKGGLLYARLEGLIRSRRFLWHMKTGLPGTDNSLSCREVSRTLTLLGYAPYANIQ